MKLKTWIAVGVVVVCLALFVFGRETFSYFAGAREYTQAAVKNSVPAEFEISRLKAMLSKLDRTIAQRQEALVDMQLQAEGLEKEIRKRQANLVKDRKALEKAADLLEKKQDSYAIGSHAYTYAEVDTDARIKANRFRQDRELLAAREDTLAHFTGTINDSRKVLSDAQVERQRLANDVESLEIRATRLSARAQIEPGKEHGKDQSLGKAYVSIQKGIAELERRLEKGERLFEIKKSGVEGINYAKNTVKKSGLEAIAEVLQ